MPTQALYNKWRSQSFSDILGQEHITRTLRNQIRAGRIGHAYLFTGLRGTGKTSTARVLAKAVNCIGETDDPPCNACHICHSVTAGSSLDLIEIDAASNRGIDEIRDLRDRVNFSPHESRFKVYVIDEVHMLTNEAFNALLKTLEEPPPHVIFVLCTTEPHRLPDTILSRCQRFDFRRGSVDTVAQKLRLICEHEEISISPEALELVARRASGSFRDAESLLDQLAAYGDQQVTLALVRDVLGSVEWEIIAQLVESLAVQDAASGLRLINAAIDGGAEPRQFLTEILDHLRALLLMRAGGSENLGNLGRESVLEMRRILDQHGYPLGRLVKTIRLFGDAGQNLRHSERPQLPLELALVESIMGEDADPVAQAPSLDRALATSASAKTTSQVERGIDSRSVSTAGQEPTVASASEAPTRRLSEGSPVAEAEAPVALPEDAAKPADSRAELATLQVSTAMGAEEPAPKVPSEAPTPAGDEPVKSTGGLSLDWVQGNWPLALIKIKPRSYQVRALLNSAVPVAVKGGTVILGCEASFHAEKLSEVRKRTLLEAVLTEVLGVPIRVEFRVQGDVRDIIREGSPAAADTTGDIFAAQKESTENRREELRNHPTVKALEERGGRISKVSLYEEDPQGGR